MKTKHKNEEPHRHKLFQYDNNTIRSEFCDVIGTHSDAATIDGCHIAIHSLQSNVRQTNKRICCLFQLLAFFFVCLFVTFDFCRTKIGEVNMKMNERKKKRDIWRDLYISFQKCNIFSPTQQQFLFIMLPFIAMT